VLAGVLAAAYGLTCSELVCGELRAAPGKLTAQLALHQFEDGPELALTHEFLPGETIYISCRITGFQPPKPDERVKLEWELQGADAAGLLIEKPKSGKIEATVLAEDRNWIPKFIETMVIPPFAPTGDYKLAVKVREQASGSEAAAEVKLIVRGHQVELSDTLIARNFHFFRSEQDRAPLRDSVYHSGEMLWARFDITGFKLGPNNHFDVEYGLAILKDGQQVFAQPAAASESNESFYPQRYVPGALSLSVDPSVPKGAYTLVVTMRDKVGNQSFDLKEAFRVE
jgi:hypothetical protein